MNGPQRKTHVQLADSDGVESTVSGVFEDLKFKISEGQDQNWSFSGSALSAVSFARSLLKF